MISYKTGAERSYRTLERAVEELERQIAAALKRSPAIIRPMLEHLALSTGKNLRGRALLISAMNDEGMIDTDAIVLAAAIELFHLATLVHDDVIDNADFRRAQESLQRRFGQKQAVLCGDYVLARAVEMVAELNDCRPKEGFSIASYAKLVCLGELRQNANSFNFDLSIYRYLTIIRGKTAMLFEAAFAGGAWILGDEKSFDAYRRLGRYIGMIFQMMDDLIDLEQTAQTAKKPILSDLRSGVITLPVILAMQNSPQLKEELRKQARQECFDAEPLRQKILDALGNAKTRAFAQRYYRLAEKELRGLHLTEQKERCLRELLQKASGEVYAPIF